MINSNLHERIADTVALLHRPAEAAPLSWQGPLLHQLFEALSQASHEMVGAGAERKIWSIWCSHQDAKAQAQMIEASRALATRNYVTAETLMDGLVEGWPEWAEAWNKRATLYFLQQRDADSVADIQRTLALEPRHFGALCGFAQICLRSRDEPSALLALERALAIHPHLGGVRDNVDALRATGAPTLH